jgi:poly(3-hydroxybutyrate) depolymerase
MAGGAGTLGAGGTTPIGQAGSVGPGGLGGTTAAATGGSSSVAGTGATGGLGGVGPAGTGGTGGTSDMAGTMATGGQSGASATGGTGGVGTGGSAGTSSGGSGGAAGTGSVARSAGCGKPQTLTAMTQPAAGHGEGGRITIQSGGQDRSFIVRLPDDYDMNQAYWLIFGFHWNGGLADDVDSGGTSQYDFSYYGLQKKSENGAIFVAPQGIGNAWMNPGGRDLTFTDDMVALIEEELCVDTDHIISTGFSYGAGMSYALACARADVFDAVVLYEGAQLSGCEGGNDPIAYLQLAGLTDDITKIVAARPMRDKFAANNGCTPMDPPEPPDGSLTHICTSYEGCMSGYPLRWCAHGSGHTPAPVDGDPTLVDGINSWSPQEVWDFLSQL